MKHIFDTDIAKEYGLHTAIILENLNFWIAKNEANSVNYFDGYYWTYNSIKAFSELFPYMSKKQIRATLDKMTDHGLIVKGNYNKSPYDRTCWYAITQKGRLVIDGKGAEAFTKNDFSICPTGQMKMTSGANEIDPQGEPIPDINTDNKPGVNTDRERIDYSRIISAYNETCVSLPHIRSLSEARKKAIAARIHSGYTYEDIEEVFRKAEASSFLKGKNQWNWSATFDWLIKDANMAKVLDGNYDDKTSNDPVPSKGSELDDLF